MYIIVQKGINPMNITTMSDVHYPEMVRGYIKAPQALYYDGDKELFNSRCIAVVGTREPSELGIKTAYAIARFFAQQGYTIVSGLARGIDTAAHKGALSIPFGRTIAILGTSLKKIYPYENTQLAHEIAERGLVYTEYETDEYAPKRFFERDHLQAAQSMAVIPIQAGAKSGTMHTVRSAFNQKRRIFLPVPIACDLKVYPEKYEGILAFMRTGHGTTFEGKQEYPKLLEILQQTQHLK
jgi:DNA processing protein